MPMAMPGFNEAALLRGRKACGSEGVTFDALAASMRPPSFEGGKAVLHGAARCGVVGLQMRPPSFEGGKRLNVRLVETGNTMLQ